MRWDGGREESTGWRNEGTVWVCVCVECVNLTGVGVRSPALLLLYYFSRQNERQKRKFRSRVQSVTVRGINKVRSDSRNSIKLTHRIWLIWSISNRYSVIQSVAGVKRGVFVCWRCIWITSTFNLFRNTANVRTDNRGRFLIIKIFHKHRSEGKCLFNGFLV